MRSPSSMGRLQSSFSALGSSLPSFSGGSATTGGGAAAGDFASGDLFDVLTPAGVKSGRPVLVYVEDAEQVRDSGGHSYEQSHFADERVALASRLFSLIKIRDGSPASKAALFAGASAPRFVVFDGTGRKIGRVEGAPSASRLYGLMKEAVSGSFARSLEEFVRSYRRLLDEIDGVYAKKEALEKAKDDLAARPTPLARRKVQDIETEIRQTSEALVARERDLLQLPEKKS